MRITLSIDGGTDTAVETSMDVDGSETVNDLMAKVCKVCTSIDIPEEELQFTLSAARAKQIDVHIQTMAGQDVCQCTAFPATTVTQLVARVSAASGVPEWQVRLVCGSTVLDSQQGSGLSARYLEQCMELPKAGQPLTLTLIRNLRPPDVTDNLMGAWGVVFSRCGTYMLIGSQGPGGADGPNKEQGCISRLDLSTGQISVLHRNLKTPDGAVGAPCGIAISPCGTYALVGHFSNAGRGGAGGYIGHLELESGNLSWPYSGFKNPIDMAFSPCGKFVLVSNCDAHNIARIDLASGEITYPYSKGLRWPAGIDISPCGTYALVANSEAGNIARIDLGNHEITFPWAVEYPEGISIAPSGEFAIAGNSYGANLGYIDLRNSTITFFSEGKFGPPTHNWHKAVVKNLVIAPDASYAVVANGIANNIIHVDLHSVNR